MAFTLTAAASGPGIITADKVNMRSGPSTESEVLIVLYSGAAVNVHGVYGNWYEIDYNGMTGYVYSSYVSLTGETIVYNLEVEPTVAPAQFVVPTSTSTPEPTITPTPIPIYSTVTGQDIVNTVMQYLGTPYLWGGESIGGFDCSGLIYTTYAQHNIKINRVAQWMLRDGVKVSFDNLQLGDILLFGSSIYNIWHAGIYIGDGNIIHASYGEVVKIQSLNSISGMSLVAARRVIE